MESNLRRALPLLSLLLIGAITSADAASTDALSSTIDRSDAIAVLNERLEKGLDKLEFEKNGLGFLKSVLNRLDVDPDSQIFVFSKTSLQHKLISPDRPRAIYFNERVAIGSPQGTAVLEIMTPTREHGYAFYTMENTDPDKPRFVKHEGALCGRCHGSDAIEPGLFVASTMVGEDGNAALIFKDGPARLFNFTDQTTPIAERWGGWYVTGTHGAQTHLGNGAFIYKDDGTKSVYHTDAQNAESLEKFFDVTPYLRSSSDIVALMTFEHQARITNMLLAAGVAARRAKELQPQMVDDLVAYMLFSGEAPLTAPVKGNTQFAATFSSQGPRDKKGRSLREFDLNTRLFKYPLSYMIYSPTFEALPSVAKRQVYDKVVAVLEGRNSSPRYAHLSAGDRANILSILRETFPTSALN